MDNYSKRFTDNKLSTITPKHSTMSTTNYNIIISSDNNSKTLPSKTPSKTPLRLSSTKKTTPNSLLTNDRYIPNRSGHSNMEASFHLLVSRKDQENVDAHGNITDNNNLDNIKRKLINETCQGVNGDKAKVLNLRSKQPGPDQEKGFNENSIKMYGSSLMATSVKKNSPRVIQTVPEKILDAPEYLDDFYLNLIDWSSTNNLAVALNKDLYIWNATTKEISMLFSIDENSSDYISSVSWIQKGNILAIGNSKNTIELWDVNKKACVRQMKSHKARIGALAWNSHQLSSGSRSGEIHSHDVRISQHHTATLKLHSQEVCGLKWSPDHRYLASGANDNLVGIWESTNHQTSSGTTPLFVFREHQAAVKALAWCPWQSNVIATGGGTSDKHIKLWGIHSGAVSQNIDAKSQVSALLWSNLHRELISSHGYPHNQLSIWKCGSEMKKSCELMGHSNRVLCMSQSPDEESVVSIGADETLRFWRCFAMDDKMKKSKEAARIAKSSSAQNSGLARCIR
jgi:cell division cycle protein 20 (cofactor of APC complex)